MSFVRAFELNSKSHLEGRLRRRATSLAKWQATVPGYSRCEEEKPARRMLPIWKPVESASRWSISRCALLPTTFRLTLN